jgi:hypothetical protein
MMAGAVMTQLWRRNTASRIRIVLVELPQLAPASRSLPVSGSLVMSGKKTDFIDSSHQRQMALSRWDNEGGAGPRGPQEGLKAGEVQSEVPELTNAELVHLRIRVSPLNLKGACSPS